MFSSNTIVLLISGILTFIAAYTAIDLLMMIRTTIHQSKRRLLYVGSSCALGMGIWILNFINSVFTVKESLVSMNIPAVILTLLIGIAMIALGYLSLTKKVLYLYHLLYASLMLTMAVFSNYMIGMYALHHEFTFNPVQLSGSFIIIYCMFILAFIILFYPSRFHRGNTYFLKSISTFMMTGAIAEGHFLLQGVFPVNSTINNTNELVIHTSFLTYMLFFVSILVLCGLLIPSTIISRRLSKSDNYLKDIRFALDQSSIVAITDPRGMITYVNDKFVEISEYSEEELLGKNHSIINSGYHSKEFFADLWNTIKQGKTWRGEICNKKKSGDFYWVATTIVPFMENGVPYQYISIRTDITSRKQAENDLKRSKELLHQQDKLAAVGQLAAGVAHEIRNPLTSMKGYTEYLQSEEKDSNRIEYFDIILDEIDRVNLIVEDFLVLAKPQTVQLETKNIIPIIQNVLSLMEFDGRKKNVTFYFESRLDHILVRCDENRLKQVFLNFVKNGIEAMPNGGNIKVTTELRDGEVQISIEDTGVGISPERLKKLGEPFYTTKKTGNGLGLMVSFNIIEGHQGRIIVESEVNKGTTFNILLPAAESA